MGFRISLFFLWIGLIWPVSAHSPLIQKCDIVRGVWMATVENIDFPSKPDITPEQFKAEYSLILDRLAQMGINAIFFQIRPSADAFYESKSEPYSRYFIKNASRWDPLPFLIQEAHDRNMKFHAWINPYRVLTNIQRPHPSPKHVSNAHPEWVVTYGTQKWLNPGLPEVWTYLNEVINEIITQYPVDGIHLDDYFYPYKVPGKSFPDQQTFLNNTRGLNLGDWRRNNVDTIILQLSNTIKAANRDISFGISPFGVWRNQAKDPEGSNTRAGMTNYDDLYADVLLWCKKGWIDYVAPQLYWETGNGVCDYETLVAWWNNHSYGRDVYIGHAVYRALKDPVKKWADPHEMPRQYQISRKYSQVKGNIFYNTSSLLRNPRHFADSLMTYTCPE